MNPVTQIIEDRQAAKNLGDTNADLCFLALSDYRETNQHTQAPGEPSVRTLVLRDIEAGRFTLFINKTSPKWHIMQHSPRAQLLLWYSSIQKQYRVSGRLQELDQEIVEAHWHLRPGGSKYLDHAYEQLGAQSSVIASRDTLINHLDQLKKTSPEDQLTRPPGATGVVLTAETIDCLSLNHRIHDRRRFTFQKATGRDTDRDTDQGNGWMEQVLIP